MLSAVEPVALPDLTDRERDVLERLASGATNDAIAREAGYGQR